MDEGLSYDELVANLHALDGVTDVGTDNPVLEFRGRKFLHFHFEEDGTFADVRFGLGGFEPVPASTPAERAALLQVVSKHVQRINRARKVGRHRR